MVNAGSNHKELNGENCQVTKKKGFILVNNSNNNKRKSFYRFFLWSGDQQITKKTLIAWEKVCSLKYVGGLKVISLHDWKVVNSAKLLWNLSTKLINYEFDESKSYFMKGRDVSIYQISSNSLEVCLNTETQ